jgi:hypothetical protein
MISVSSCISVMGRLDMVSMELTYQNLILLTMCLTEQPQELLGPLPSFFRAFHVDAEQHDLPIMALINKSHYVGSLCHFKALNIGGVISKQHVMLFKLFIRLGLVVKCL